MKEWRSTLNLVVMILLACFVILSNGFNSFKFSIKSHGKRKDSYFFDFQVTCQSNIISQKLIIRSKNKVEYCHSTNEHELQNATIS